MVNRPIGHVSLPPAGRGNERVLQPKFAAAEADGRGQREAEAVATIDELSAAINAAHRRASEAARHSLEYAREAGELLIKVKDRLKHGDWMPWLEEEFAGTPRTAQLYMRIACRWQTL